MFMNGSNTELKKRVLTLLLLKWVQKQAINPSCWKWGQLFNFILVRIVIGWLTHHWRLRSVGSRRPAARTCWRILVINQVTRERRKKKLQKNKVIAFLSSKRCWRLLFPRCCPSQVTLTDPPGLLWAALKALLNSCCDWPKLLSLITSAAPPCRAQEEPRRLYSHSESLYFKGKPIIAFLAVRQWYLILYLILATIINDARSKIRNLS